MAKNVLLIGASGGLGKHLTQGLADAGHNLALHYHDHPGNIEESLEGTRNKNAKYKTYKADITSENEVIEMVSSVKKDFGTIDILINNAGLSINGMSWKMSLDDWNKVISVNLTGP